MVLGVATEVTGEQKAAALETITEHLLPGRWAEARHPNKKELAATLVLSLPLDEVSVKVSDGPPEDEPADIDLPIWAGVVPMRETFRQPIPAPDLKARLSRPDVRQRLVALSQEFAQPARAPAPRSTVVTSSWSSPRYRTVSVAPATSSPTATINSACAPRSTGVVRLRMRSQRTTTSGSRETS